MARLRGGFKKHVEEINPHLGKARHSLAAARRAVQCRVQWEHALEAAEHLAAAEMAAISADEGERRGRSPRQVGSQTYPAAVRDSQVWKETRRLILDLKRRCTRTW